MKWFASGLLVAALGGVVLIPGSGSVGAQSCDGNISNTGPDSTNIVECEEVDIVKVRCENNIYVVNNSSQTSESGDASTSGNTSGGSATSGSAINENGATVEIGASCGTVTETTEPTTPTPTEEAEAPQPGEVKSASTTVAALPDTASSLSAPMLAIGVSVVAVLFALVRVGMYIYQRF